MWVKNVELFGLWSQVLLFLVVNRNSSGMEQQKTKRRCNRMMCSVITLAQSLYSCCWFSLSSSTQRLSLYSFDTRFMCNVCAVHVLCISWIRDSRIYHVACIDGDAPVENSIRLFRLRWFHRIDIWLVSRFFFFCTKKAQSMNMCVSIEQSFPSFFHSVWLFSGSSRSVVCDKMLPTY